jgi:hypothetical protein
MTRGRRVLALVLGVAVLAGACSDDDGGDATPRPDETPVTALVDYSGVPLHRVDGTTTTTGAREHGTASIVGTVSTAAGVHPGATVRIERLLAGREVRSDIATGPDGRFELRNVPGGRYRVRAFLPPALAMSAPDVRFLADGEEHTFDLVMEDQRGVVARASVAPDPPELNEAVNLVAVVASRTVDFDGIVRTTPVIGVRVELTGLGRWSLRAPLTSPGRPLSTTTTATSIFRSNQGTVAFTDSLGQVRFELRCDSVGPAGLSLQVPVTVQPETVPGQPPSGPVTRIESLALTVPECVDPTAAVAPATEGTVDADTDDGEDADG